MSAPTNITREHILKAIEKIDSEPELKTKRSSSTYDLIFEGKKYPPILVLSIANQINNGKELLLSDFDNNIEKPFNLLRENGFTIIPKKNNYDQTEQALIEYVQTFDEYEWFDEFFGILEYIISEASLKDSDQKIAFTLVKVKKRISINIGARLIFAICRTKKVNWFYVMLNAADIVEARKLSEYYTQEEEDTFKSGVEASLIPFTTGWSTASKLWILKAFSEAVNAQLPAVKSAGQPEKHNNFIYKAAVDLNYRTALKQKIVENINLIPEIVAAIKSDFIQNAIKEEDFRFQKASDHFNYFKNLKEPSALFYKVLQKKYLDSDSTYSDFIKTLSKESEEYKLIYAIGKLISYIDVNAANKNELNEYDDNRTLAQTGIRQTLWLKYLLEYKVNNNDYSTFTPIIKSALIYLEDPTKEITLFSEKHREWVAINLLKQPSFNRHEFVNQFISFFKPYGINPKNPLNNNRIISEILYYFPDVEKLWKEGNDKVKQNTTSINTDFHTKTNAAGLIFSQQLIQRFIASLCTKPFVILCGLSGSGKTKLAQAFVQWISESEKQYKIIPVGADWSNREPPNIGSTFVSLFLEPCNLGSSFCIIAMSNKLSSFSPNNSSININLPISLADL